MWPPLGLPLEGCLAVLRNAVLRYAVLGHAVPRCRDETRSTESQTSPTPPPTVTYEPPTDLEEI